MKKKILIGVITILFLTGMGFTISNMTRTEYVASIPIVLTAEEKLTQDLQKKMVAQTEAKRLRVRAELALIEARELETKADSDVVDSLEGIMLYQGM